jgi:NNP family nitrate/nitrite transporter-like MFS transporter
MTDTTTDDDRKGHLPTLIACFLHFDLSFMLWVLVGALGILIAEDLGLSAAERVVRSRAAACERVVCGSVTGILGAIGLIGGFCLPILLGVVRQYGGGFGSGFVLLALLAASVVAVLQALTVRRDDWRMSWRLQAPGFKLVSLKPEA